MRIFIAAPYSSLCNKNYVLKTKYKIFFENLISDVTDMKCEYFLAHKRENWGKNYSSAEESTEIDFNIIKNSDLVIVIPGSPISGGVHVEVGWASAFKRKMILFLKKGENYSPMITGLSAICDVDYIYYEGDFTEDLYKKIIDNINKYREEKNEI